MLRYRLPNVSKLHRCILVCLLLYISNYDNNEKQFVTFNYLANKIKVLFTLILWPQFFKFLGQHWTKERLCFLFYLLICLSRNHMFEFFCRPRYAWRRGDRGDKVPLQVRQIQSGEDDRGGEVSGGQRCHTPLQTPGRGPVWPPKHASNHFFLKKSNNAMHCQETLNYW